MFGPAGFIAGILLVAVGAFLVFFFPTAVTHQPQSMSLTGIVMGIIFLVVGFVLLFLP
jgi:hypothetical protein